VQSVKAKHYTTKFQLDSLTVVVVKFDY